MFIIAEAGVNHNGNIETAMALVDEAAEAGADAVKFQLFDPEKLEPPGERREMLKGLTLRSDQIFKVMDYCGDRIEFMVTPFDVESLEFAVNNLKVLRLKISSGGLFDDNLLHAARKSGLPVILSTGMTSLTEIHYVIKFLKGVDVILLHCNSGYPTPPEDANISALVAMKAFGCPLGLSDHTFGMAAPILAVGYGARVIEKHLTLHRGLEGPDHHISLEPHEFEEMVLALRDAEKMVGDGIKRPTGSERGTQKIIKDRREWAA